MYIRLHSNPKRHDENWEGKNRGGLDWIGGAKSPSCIHFCVGNGDGGDQIPIVSSLPTMRYGYSRARDVDGVTKPPSWVLFPRWGTTIPALGMGRGLEVCQHKSPPWVPGVWVLIKKQK
mmetsp:Transcript_35734/g.41408  ORF Transcript_35734/g.41408 Transcript_35734/m.41408 type:complete len:119 (-) Transcript_35734:66-422(-)